MYSTRGSETGLQTWTPYCPQGLTSLGMQASIFPLELSCGLVYNSGMQPSLMLKG